MSDRAIKHQKHRTTKACLHALRLMKCLKNHHQSFTYLNCQVIKICSSYNNCVARFNVFQLHFYVSDQPDFSRLVPVEGYFQMRKCTYIQYREFTAINPLIHISPHSVIPAKFGYVSTACSRFTGWPQRQLF